MGCFSVYCGVSNISITEGDRCFILPLEERIIFTEKHWVPFCLPIEGTYDDYGQLGNVVRNNNVDLIEKTLNVDIYEFLENLYSFEKGKTIEGLPEKLSYMWINGEVFDFLTKETSRKEDNKYFYVGIENTFFPLQSHIMSFERSIKTLLSHKKFDNLRDEVNFYSEVMYPELSKMEQEILINLIEKDEDFCNEAAKLVQLRHKMMIFSKIFEPFIPCITPQCGEHREHEKIVKKFHSILVKESKKYR
jgi:hypothetical protein